MNLSLILAIACLASFGGLVHVHGHGYLGAPISRNALSLPENGLCSWWGGDIPCTGNSQSWNQEEPTTGCGIVQSGGTPYVFGDGLLSFAHTGYKTTYTAGETVTMSAKITAHHGGRMEFRMQDVGASNDPDGSLWASSELLTVESFSPLCDDPVNCGTEPCVDEKTCAQVPFSPYGSNDGVITMQVKLPDVVCEHCVLQWRYVTGNSCSGTRTSCEESEKFWNCADIELVGEDVPTRSPTQQPAGPTPAEPTGMPVAAPTLPPSALDCYSIDPDYSDNMCRTQLLCDPLYCEMNDDTPTEAPTVVPSELETLLCSLEQKICRKKNLATLCTYVEELCNPSEEVPSTSAPTQLPTNEPTDAPTDAPTAADTDDDSETSYVGYYDWTWSSAADWGMGSDTNLGVAFSGWADVANALDESSSMMSSLPGKKYLSIGGGNANGHLTAARLTALNDAIVRGDLDDYDGVCYDVEEGDAGIESAFAESFSVAKANGFSVLVTVSHSAPYGFSDKEALMNSFFESDDIDMISPQLYTSGYEAANDYAYTMAWSEYAKSKAAIVPSIVRADFYADAHDFFASPARSGLSVQTAGYIQWAQTVSTLRRAV